MHRSSILSICKANWLKWCSMTTHAQMREGFGTATFEESQYYTDSRKFGGVISNRMSVYIDKSPHTAVIRFTHNSLIGEKLDVDKLKSRENSANRIDTGYNIINKIDSHLRLLTDDSNVRPTSSGISDKIDLGATQASSPQNDGERGEDDVHLQQIECNNVSSKSSSRKGRYRYIIKLVILSSKILCSTFSLMTCIQVWWIKPPIFSFEMHHLACHVSITITKPEWKSQWGFFITKKLENSPPVKFQIEKVSFSYYTCKSLLETGFWFSEFLLVKLDDMCQCKNLGFFSHSLNSVVLLYQEHVYFC